MSRYTLVPHNPDHLVVVGTRRAPMVIPDVLDAGEIDGIYYEVTAGHGEGGGTLERGQASTDVSAVVARLREYAIVPLEIEERLADEVHALTDFRRSGAKMRSTEDRYAQYDDPRIATKDYRDVAWTRG